MNKYLFSFSALSLACSLIWSIFSFFSRFFSLNFSNSCNLIFSNSFFFFSSSFLFKSLFSFSLFSSFSIEFNILCSLCFFSSLYFLAWSSNFNLSFSKLSKNSLTLILLLDLKSFSFSINLFTCSLIPFNFDSNCSLICLFSLILSFLIFWSIITYGILLLLVWLNIFSSFIIFIFSSTLFICFSIFFFLWFNSFIFWILINVS